MLALTDFVALNADFLVVGNLTRPPSLGLYSLAFTLAFAPVTQVSWQVGRVLFPAAAATSDPATVGRRTLVSLRMLALLLLPLSPSRSSCSRHGCCPVCSGTSGGPWSRRSRSSSWWGSATRSW